MEYKRAEALNEYEQLQNKTRKLKDLITKRLTTQEHKEILELICKNFEFEMKNIEIQAELFIRDSKIREKEMIILRLEQHRSLCDTLISQQKEIIKDKNISVNNDLSELYYLYSRDVNEGKLQKDISEASTTNPVFPKVMPYNSAFLTQIQEEDLSSNELLDENREKIYDKNLFYPNLWTKRQLASKFEKNDFENKNSNKSSKSTFTETHANKTMRREHKRDNIIKSYNSYNSGNNNNNNYFLNNNENIPHFAFNTMAKDNRNNISTASASTSDSNIEIIVENPKDSVKNNFKSNFDELLSSPPGHVNSSFHVSNVNSSTKTLKRHTQGIAAVAAQRKATLHHRELMVELTKTDESGNDSSQTGKKLVKANIEKDEACKATKTKTSEKLTEKTSILIENLSLGNDKKPAFSNSHNKKIKKQVKINDSLNDASDENKKESNVIIILIYFVIPDFKIQEYIYIYSVFL